jgi:two-component system, NarL family, sensor histidine kinase UhpB
MRLSSRLERPVMLPRSTAAAHLHPVRGCAGDRAAPRDGRSAALAPLGTLKLRVSLLITVLLAIATLAGGVYIVRKARDDTRAEVRSTVNLASRFFDAQLAQLRERWSDGLYRAPLLRLRELGDIRHLSVRLYDDRGNLLDSNESPGEHTPLAPHWFTSLLRFTSPPLQPQMRVISLDGAAPPGRLVIAPDPTYEADEMWSTSRGLLGLDLLFFVLVTVLVWWAVSRAMRPIEEILQALGELRRGNLGVRLPDFGVAEMSRISVGFNHMAETLERSVTENRRLTRRLLTTQESERRSLARELHDEIGQCVSAIHADAAAIRNRSSDTVRESAEAIVAVTAQIKQIVRSMLQRLRPPVLEGLGLTPALRELVGAFQQRNPQMSCSLTTRGALGNLDAELGIAVYRVVQECLTNIARHADARHAVIDVDLSPADRTASGAAPDGPGHPAVHVTVADDGVGFQPAGRVAGFGLMGIRERVSALGGTYDIASRPGQGTSISVVVPVPLALEEAS